MNRRIFAAALLMLVSAKTMQSRAAPAPDHGSCLAGLCIEDESATERTLIRQLGEGAVGSSEAGARTHCYVDAKAGVWAEFGFEDHPSRWSKPTLNSIMLTTRRFALQNSDNMHRISGGGWGALPSHRGGRAQEVGLRRDGVCLCRPGDAQIPFRLSRKGRRQDTVVRRDGMTAEMKRPRKAGPIHPAAAVEPAWPGHWRRPLEGEARSASGVGVTSRRSPAPRCPPRGAASPGSRSATARPSRRPPGSACPRAGCAGCARCRCCRR